MGGKHPYRYDVPDPPTPQRIVRTRSPMADNRLQAQYERTL